jgi:tetratricopeptide (TPR) repeat protein
MKYVFTTIILMLAMQVSAQINKPALSPRIEVKQQVGLVNVTLDYGQPSRRDRAVLGTLIPFGEVWRTGANSSTKISFDRTVKLGQNTIPKGDYALYTIPEKNEWTIIIHKNTKLWGAGGYDQANDLIRFKVPVIQLKDTSETMNIKFENFTMNGGDLTISWETAKVTIPLYVDSDEIIFNEILEKTADTVKNVSAQTYYDAAKFYNSKGKDLKTAMVWLTKAVELKPTAFWMVYYKAELAYDLKDYKLAKETAQKCNELAKASASDYGYISKSEQLLKLISEKE